MQFSCNVGYLNGAEIMPHLNTATTTLEIVTYIVIGMCYDICSVNAWLYKYLRENSTSKNIGCGLEYVSFKNPASPDRIVY